MTAPTRRDLLLAAAGSALVGALPDSAFADAQRYDVSYGVGSNLAELRRNHGIVARLLGPGVAKDLVVVRLDSAGATPRYALVYQRGGDLAGTQTVAARHARLLRSHGVGATAIASGGEIVFPASAVVLRAPSAPVEPSPLVEEPVTARIAAPERPREPVAEPSAPVDARGDAALELAIEQHVKALRTRGRVADDEGTSWLVWDLDGDRELASINADVPRQAASMIKPLVMLAFFHEVEAGRIVYGSVSRGKLESMIQHSSNAATNWTIDLLGGPRGVQAILRSAYGALVPDTRIVEKIPTGGATYRNKASVGDYGRYLRAAWRGELPRAAEQRRILGLPNRDRLYHGASSIPAGTFVLDKTGSTSRCCGDMGIVVARRRGGGTFPYVFCGVIEKAQRTSAYGRWIADRGDVIRGVSDLTYRHLKDRFGLA